MQALIKLVDSIRKENPRITSGELLNTVREYLQIVILKLIYQSKYGQDLSFVGGTCLRICYDLKRYSEDLDFTLDGKTTSYDFQSLVLSVQKDLALRNIEADVKINEDKTVQKAFAKATNVLDKLELSITKGQKLHIKIEVDTNPVNIRYGQRESFFVTKYNEIFPILKHDLETLFAGKALAIFCRPYQKGRDFYDLIWYLNHSARMNLAYLNEGLRAAGCPAEFSNEEAVFEQIGGIVTHLKPDFIIDDIGRFLEDPKEEIWIRQYAKVFRQLKEARFSR